MDELSRLPEFGPEARAGSVSFAPTALEQHRPLRSIAIEAGIPYRTAQPWVTRYQRFGLAALVRKKRTDAGVRRAVPIKIQAVIEGLALQKPPPPIAALHRQVQRFAQNLGEEAPSYKVVYRIVRGLPADLLTLALEGTKAYSEAFDLVHRREASGPNAIWQADHTPLDILLVRADRESEKHFLVEGLISASQL
jgi:putative transposase